jgi:hypothetical protein
MTDFAFAACGVAIPRNGKAAAVMPAAPTRNASRRVSSPDQEVGTIEGIAPAGVQLLGGTKYSLEDVVRSSLRQPDFLTGCVFHQSK